MPRIWWICIKIAKKFPAFALKQKQETEAQHGFRFLIKGPALYVIVLKSIRPDRNILCASTTHLAEARGQEVSHPR